MTMLVSEKNRLSAATAIAVRPRIKTHIAWLEQELYDLDKDLRRTLRESNRLGSQAELTRGAQC